METSEAFVLIQALLSEHTGMEPESITMNQQVVEDLMLDSVDAVELMIAVEKRAGVRFDVGQVENLQTVEDIVQRVVAAADGSVAST